MEGWGTLWERRSLPRTGRPLKWARAESDGRLSGRTQAVLGAAVVGAAVLQAGGGGGEAGYEML